jgi:uncharacterized membrane protein
MKATAFLLALFGVALAGTVALRGADPTPPARDATKEEIQARLAEHARKKALGPTAEAAASKASADKSKVGTAGPAAAVSPAPAPTDSATAAKSAPAGPAAAVPAEETPKVLPKVEVKNGRITELDIQVQKQNEEIAREKKNTQPTKLDETLNGPKISKALALFGGQSSDDRANVAKERVAMMEDERNLIEAIAQAKNKEEKEELEKTLEQARAMRRDLENDLR